VRWINHQHGYSVDRACTNGAESYFSRLRRAELGHHHIAGPYLFRYAEEAAWREDLRRVGNDEQAHGVAGCEHALNQDPSLKWMQHTDFTISSGGHVGSRSAPTETPPLRRFSACVQCGRPNSSGVPVGRLFTCRMTTTCTEAADEPTFNADLHAWPGCRHRGAAAPPDYLRAREHAEAPGRRLAGRPGHVLGRRRRRAGLARRRPFHRAARHRLPAALGHGRRLSPAARRSTAIARLLRRCVHELWALFVDDGAIAAVAWIAVACLTLRQVTAGIRSGPILFAGLSAIFLLTTRARP